MVVHRGEDDKMLGMGKIVCSGVCCEFGRVREGGREGGGRIYGSSDSGQIGVLVIFLPHHCLTHGTACKEDQGASHIHKPGTHEPKHTRTHTSLSLSLNCTQTHHLMGRENTEHFHFQRCSMQISSVSNSVNTH